MRVGACLSGLASNAEEMPSGRSTMKQKTKTDQDVVLYTGHLCLGHTCLCMPVCF